MLTYRINSRLLRGEESVKIDVPLSANFALDMNQDLLSSEMFFEKIKADVLPPITDMEKIVIYPAVYEGDEDGKPVLSLADEIEINFHFRRRWDYDTAKNRNITEGWLSSDVWEWTTGETMDSEGVTHTPEGEIIPFNPTNYDERSDLVGYLGFIDNDIYYQKTKVKKSFLRLMFYDSKDLLNKNLLTYSTTFLDSGKLFTKYSKIRNNKELFRFVQETENREDEMVMFEPGNHLNMEKYDSLRLSSMVTLKDKFNDDASSDGFYIYLFKQDAPSELPIDLYLKAEFNNAKYGKTVNLMLPVRESTTGDTETLPTGVPIRFGDEDFPHDFIKEAPDSEKQNFNFDAYYNSLYINVKCKFDKNLKKYVYYFPWDPGKQRAKMGEEEENQFTLSNDPENHKITLNFFEPKLNRGEEL
jgi:hypothetical protein